MVCWKVHRTPGGTKWNTRREPASYPVEFKVKGVRELLREENSLAQDELEWAGNSGTQPAAGNGTCGNGTLSNTFAGANYNTAFSYTHLGQLWQGPLNGTGANEQYLYCTSSALHQLSYLVPAGQSYSCTNLPSTIAYALQYNAWGDANSRATSTGTAALNSNDFDQIVECHIPNTNQAWDGYDASGRRMVQHTKLGPPPPRPSTPSAWKNTATTAT